MCLKISAAIIFIVHGVTHGKTVILTFSSVRISDSYEDYANFLACDAVYSGRHKVSDQPAAPFFSVEE
jgi:hypothetical protein